MPLCQFIRLAARIARKCSPSMYLAVAVWLFANLAAGGGSAAETRLVLEKSEAWMPRAEAAPIVSAREDGQVAIKGNGTRLCCGGWQYVFSGVRGGQGYRFQVRVRHRGLGNARDCLAVILLWDRWDPSSYRTGMKPWDYAIPTFPAKDRTDFSCVVQAPADATHVTVRYVFRWSPEGTSQWTAPKITPATIPTRSPVQISIVPATRQPRDRLPAPGRKPISQIRQGVAQLGVAEGLGRVFSSFYDAADWCQCVSCCCIQDWDSFGLIVTRWGDSKM